MLVDVSVDGATVICEKPFSVGTRTTIAVEGISMAELPAIIVSNEGDFGGGYRLILRITRGSWPYQVFVTLTTLAAGTARNSSTPPPPCLEELGLKLPCSAEDVRIAFQRRVRGVHPDRGGDVESFVRLRAAYHQALDLLGGQR